MPDEYRSNKVYMPVINRNDSMNISKERIFSFFDVTLKRPETVNKNSKHNDKITQDAKNY